MVPGAVCRAKVGLEMVKYNGDSVRPEGPEKTLQQWETEEKYQGSSGLSEEIGVKNVAPYFLK